MVPAFPSPAADFAVKRIDVTDRLVVHPQAAYPMRVSGESMRKLGIFDGDVLLVETTLKLRHGVVVVAWWTASSPASCCACATAGWSCSPLIAWPRSGT